MKLKDLVKLVNCPEWIKNPNIKVSNENIELNEMAEAGA